MEKLENLNTPSTSTHFFKKDKEGSIKKEPFSASFLSKQLEGFDLEPQQEIAAIGYFLLRHRAEEVGMYEIQNFNPASVATWDEYQEHFWADFHNEGRLGHASAVLDDELNMMTTGDGGRSASLAQYTHEMAHFVASSKNIPVETKNTERIAKTGFVSAYTPKRNDETKSRRESFRLFNEGVTEMLTHDLCDDMTLEKLDTLYKGIFPKKAKKNLEKAKVEHQVWLEKIKITEKQMQEKELAEFIPFIEGIKDEKDRAMYTRAHQGRMGMVQRLIKSRENELNTMEILPISYGEPLEDKDEISYKEMVELVSQMLDGVGLKNANTEISFESARNEAWKELQKAYFKGNVTHLKIFESIYGENFLKKLASLNYDNIQIDEANETIIWKEYDEIKKIIESTNKILNK